MTFSLFKRKKDKKLINNLRSNDKKVRAKAEERLFKQRLIFHLKNERLHQLAKGKENAKEVYASCVNKILEIIQNKEPPIWTLQKDKTLDNFFYALFRNDCSKRREKENAGKRGAGNVITESALSTTYELSNESKTIIESLLAKIDIKIVSQYIEQLPSESLCYKILTLLFKGHQNFEIAGKLSKTQNHIGVELKKCRKKMTDALSKKLNYFDHS